MKRKRPGDCAHGDPAPHNTMAPSGHIGGKRSKVRRLAADQGQEGDVIVVESHHSEPKSISNGANVVPASIPTPQKSRRSQSAVTTPSASNARSDVAPALPNADRSARRKSTRRLIERTIADDVSDQDELGLEEDLAHRIRDEDEAEDEESEADVEAPEEPEEDQPQEASAQTPSKKPRGRPKGWRKQRTPTPPRDLPAYEHYFFQNRPGGTKTSNKTLSSLALISHEDYFAKIKEFKDHHEPSQDFLHSLHRRSFDQWIFELSQGFNICVYGFGSKRELLIDFATHLSAASPHSKIVVINGYNARLTSRDILNTLASIIPTFAKTKLPAQPGDVTTAILQALEKSPPPTPALLLLHTLDGPALRRAAAQQLLARLASSPHIQLLASADTPNFALLWDAALATQFNWLFHDTTTFQPLDVEIAGGVHGGVVDEVNALLGRSGRKLQGREGVMYVLKSLTENARSLYALLVAELLSLEGDDDDGAGDAYDGGLDEDDGGDVLDGFGGGDADEDFEDALGEPDDAADFGRKKSASGGARRRRRAGGMRATIEYHSLYTKAMEQLITTNEVNYRGLLKEFYDHEMIVSSKDALGTETLGVPFRREEMEVLLGELVGG